MLLPSLLKSGDQVYQKVIKQLYQKMLLLNLLITLQNNKVMKTLYIFTILLFLLYIAGSCNDDQQKLFSGSTTMHFALSDNELDSIACSFPIKIIVSV